MFISCNQQPTKELPDSEFSVQDREALIIQMAYACIKNMLLLSSIAKGGVADETILLLAAQMYGSGKTTLGKVFLSELKTSKYDLFWKWATSRFPVQSDNLKNHTEYPCVLPCD